MWEVDFQALEWKYHETDSRFEFLAPNCLYTQVFMGIGRILKNGIFHAGGLYAKAISSQGMHVTRPTWHAADSQDSGLQSIDSFFFKIPNITTSRAI